MKYIIISIFLSVFAYADELSRMESIVVDIENLRSKYTACNKELSEKTLELEENKNLLIANKKENTNTKKNDKSNKEQLNISLIKEKDEKIKILEKKYNKMLKDKDKIILSLKNKIKMKQNTKIVKKNICKDDNPFPDLIMKEKPNVSSKLQNTLELKVKSTPSTYRLNQDSIIYDDVNGKVVYNWENKTSFTSTKKTDNWLEVSGYFTDGKWAKATRSLWVKKVNATAR